MTTVSTPLVVGHWTVQTYDAAAEAGIFGIDPKIELLAGQIYPTREIGENGLASVGTPHVYAVQQLCRSAFRYFERNQVGSQMPIILGDHSEPEPDLSIAKIGSPPKPYVSDLLLVIEVADSSLRADLDIKVPLYQTSGVPEVWIVNLVDRCVYRFGTGPARRSVHAHRTYQRDSSESPFVVSIRRPPEGLLHEVTGWSIPIADLFLDAVERRSEH